MKGGATVVEKISRETVLTDVAFHLACNVATN